MWNDVSWLLVSGAVGAVIGLAMTCVSPSRCRQFARWSSDRRRSRLFAMGMFLFALGSVFSFRERNLVYGVTFGLMSMLQLFALISVRFGRSRNTG